MIDRIGILRTVADNLTSHLCTTGKKTTKITKPKAIIPGAVATAGVAVLLETNDNSAKLTVQKDNAEIQSATFNYKETPDGYDLLSASSTYYYDDKDNKEIRQTHYAIESEQEKTYEHSIDYKNAPMKKSTRTYIDKVNSSIAQVAGYKSDKTDYDPQESHIYGKKSLQRDIPALLQFLKIIAPNSEFTLKIKDKLKKDNKTSLVAFEVNDVENKNGIVRGFMSANGDSVSYHIDTEDMTIIGEQSDNKDLSKAYLKSDKAEEKSKEVTEEPKKEPPKEEKNGKTKEKSAGAKKTVQNSNNVAKTQKEIKGSEKPQTSNEISVSKSKIQPAADVSHVHTMEYYTNIIFKTATDNKLPTRRKVDIYKEVLAQAYLDGYTESELENILTGNGLHNFSYYCKKTYVGAGIALAKNGEVQQIPVKTLENKISELKNIKIDIDEVELANCVKNMIHEITKIQDDTVKEIFVDKALSILKNNSSKNFKSDLVSFIQEAGQINDDLKLNYEIYAESVDNIKVKNLKYQIEKMINNLSDTKHHRKRNNFLTKLYTENDLNELKQLQEEVQKLLDENPSQQNFEEIPKQEQLPKLSIQSLTSTNQKRVMELLNCKSPSDISMTFEQARNLILDIGFVESKTKPNGTHYKFHPPIEIYDNGERQPFFTLTGGSKTLKAASIDDLINVCKQYYEGV